MGISLKWIQQNILGHSLSKIRVKTMPEALHKNHPVSCEDISQNTLGTSKPPNSWRRVRIPFL